MSRTLRASLCAASLFGALSAGCRAEIDSVDIGGVDPASAIFAFYGTSEGNGADFSGDETNDASARLLVVLSDRRSICDDLSNVLIIDNLARIDDAVMIIINGEIFQNDSEGPLIVSDLTLDDTDADGTNKDINFRIRAFENEQSILNDTDNGDGTLTISRAGLRLQGEFSATLVGGQVLSGSFKARHCAVFDALALQGGL
jgi:hypothetical protein